jgi:hypothetical protein
MPAKRKFKDSDISFTKVREEQSQGCSLKEAIEKAVKYCIRNNILQDYLRKNSSEVLNMLYTEFKLSDAKAVWTAEAEARGEARGREDGMNKVFALLERGMPLAEAKRKLGLAGTSRQKR